MRVHIFDIIYPIHQIKRTNIYSWLNQTSNFKQLHLFISLDKGMKNEDFYRERKTFEMCLWMFNKTGIYREFGRATMELSFYLIDFSWSTPLL